MQAGELAGRPGPTGCRDYRRGGWLVGLGSCRAGLARAWLGWLARLAVETAGEVIGWLAWPAAWRGWLARLAVEIAGKVAGWLAWGVGWAWLAGPGFSTVMVLPCGGAAAGGQKITASKQAHNICGCI